MTIAKMAFPNVHNSMTRANTSEDLVGVLQKIGVSVTINQAATEFLESLLNGKDLPPVIELEWSGPFSKKSGVEWFYMDRKIAKYGGIISVNDNAILGVIPTQHM